MKRKKTGTEFKFCAGFDFSIFFINTMVQLHVGKLENSKNMHLPKTM